MVTYSKYILIASLSIAILVFIAGIFLGYSLDNFRSSEVLSNIKQSELNTESYLVHQEFLKTFGGDECGILVPRIANMKFLVGKISAQLTEYSQKKLSLNKDLDYLKRKYFLSEINFLTLVQNLKDKCNESLLIILFFYTKDDPISTRQGYVLNDLSKEYKDSLIILSFDKDYLDEPLIETLTIKYNIKESSTLIIDNNIKKEGLTSKEDLLPLIKERLA